MLYLSTGMTFDVVNIEVFFKRQSPKYSTKNELLWFIWKQIPGLWVHTKDILYDPHSTMKIREVMFYHW